MQPPATDRWRQGVGVDPRFCRNPLDGLSVIEQGLRPLQHLCRRDGRAAALRVHIELCGPSCRCRLEVRLTLNAGTPNSFPTDSRPLIGVTESGMIGARSCGIGVSCQIGVAPEKLKHLASAASSRYLSGSRAEILSSA
ncbi:hypothetical protein [Accumulibacter sp.]|uniref:hypothetical protein n=1 Tax=Accumulibacter sp. TaxID=2053492 RepID=UPI0025EBCA94|nr:hypothetical protein [Accumulibacter sp.]MCM8612695.1 hypothetical protein [Accumulibacter sp.]MCM8636465.1 hypothetical protein [Accumulibacter sp.]MCM8640171.1 hypothetical protein [Accumulibacter sp.]